MQAAAAECYSLRFDAVGRLAPAGHVVQPDRPTVERRIGFQQIAGRSGPVVDQGPAVAEQAVEQRALAAVGTPGQHDVIRFDKVPADSIGGQEPLHLRHRFPVPRRPEMLHDRLDRLAEAAPPLVEQDRRRALRSSPWEETECVGLRTSSRPIDAPGTFARGGTAAEFRQSTSDHFDAGAAVTVNFHAIVGERAHDDMLAIGRSGSDRKSSEVDAVGCRWHLGGSSPNQVPREPSGRAGTFDADAPQRRDAGRRQPMMHQRFIHRRPAHIRRVG